MKDWQALADQWRVESIRCTTEAGSGHLAFCMSAADLTAVLLTNYLRYDWANPCHPGDDRPIFSKGQPCPLLYSVFNAARVITDAKLLSLRKSGDYIVRRQHPSGGRGRDRPALPGAVGEMARG